ncbi:proprotein convertase P-domain-containing protein [Chloracidobacterium sp. E]|nr:proprotein convertase P-domain-containing protein [Chloracidobacterium aggregatum]QUV98461.1 proprotein convertase P-domain-containing protein [Chloracidobacterium sp. E]
MSRIGNPFAALISRLQRARVEDQSIAPRTRPQPPTPSETTPARPTTFSPTSLDAAHTARAGFNQADRLRANLFSMFRPAAAPTAATSAAATAGNTQTVTASATPNAAIRDFQTTTSTIAITEDLKTTGVRVDVNIAHSYASDLVVKLRSPKGAKCCCAIVRADAAPVRSASRRTHPTSTGFQPKATGRWWSKTVLAAMSVRCATGRWR